MNEGIIVEDFFPYQLQKNIIFNIQMLLNKRNELQKQVNRLEQAGCIWGNIVEEYREANGKNYGPYYRLTFYTNSNGHKPKPRYISAKQRAATQQQIDNYFQRQYLQNQIDDIHQGLNHAHYSLDQLDHFLENVGRRYDQLVIPAVLASAPANTKTE